jgi:hypothetical protein
MKIKLSKKEVKALIEALDAVIDSFNNNGISPLILMVIKKKLVE